MRRHRMGRALRRRYGRAYDGGKPLAFPDVHDFHQLFTHVGPWSYSAKEQPPGVHSGGNVIGPFLTVSGRDTDRRSYAVKPSAAVVSWLGSNLVVKGDRIYFEVIVRSPSSALVVAKHNKILGDRWLALIDPSTIPEEG
jgi:hypothetical protein